MLPATFTKAYAKFRSMVEPPVPPAVKVDRQSKLSSNTDSIRLTAKFLQRADEHNYTQPGLSPHYWFQFRNPGNMVSELSGIDEREWMLNTDYDPIESEVWIESWTDPQINNKLYGLSEANFWEFFFEKWDYGDQIRIGDGMLFTALIQYLENLRSNGVVESVVMTDYDQEMPSKDQYGVPILTKPTTPSEVPGTKTRGAKVMFNWLEPHVQKFEFRVYTLTAHNRADSENDIHDDKLLLSYKQPEPGAAPSRLSSVLMAQRLHNARKYNRTAFALESIISGKEMSRLRLAPKHPNKRPRLNRQLSRTYAQQSRGDSDYTILQMRRRDKLMRSYATSQRTTVTDHLLRVPNVDDSQGSNTVEQELPNFIYDRTDEHDRNAANLDQLQHKEISASMDDLTESKTLTGLVAHIRARRLSMEVREMSGGKLTLHTAKEKAAEQGMDVESYLSDICEYNHQRKSNHPQYPPARVRQEVLPSFDMEKSKRKPSIKVSTSTVSESRSVDLHQRSRHNSRKIENTTMDNILPQKTKRLKGKRWIQPQLTNMLAINNAVPKLSKTEASLTASLEAVDGGSMRIDPRSNSDYTDLVRVGPLFRAMTKNESSLTSVKRRDSEVLTSRNKARMSLEVHWGSGNALNKRSGEVDYQPKGPSASVPHADTKRKLREAEPVQVDHLLRWELNKLKSKANDAYQKSEVGHRNTASDSTLTNMRRFTSSQKADDHGLKPRQTKSLYTTDKLTHPLSNRLDTHQSSSLFSSHPLLTHQHGGGVDLQSRKADEEGKRLGQQEECHPSRTLPRDKMSLLNQDCETEIKTEDSLPGPLPLLDVSNIISSMAGEIFHGRHKHRDFQPMLMEALKTYRFTVETVISSRGHSITSITITKPQPAEHVNL